MAIDVRLAPEAAETVRRVLFQHHAPLLEADPVVVVMFASERKKSRGREAIGWISTLNRIERHLIAELIDATGDVTAVIGAAGTEGERYPQIPHGWLVTLVEEDWNRLSDRSREALVDHELCHAAVKVSDKGDWTVGLVGHDVEEFKAVIARHGDWLGEVEELMANRRQFESSVQLRLLEEGA